MIGDLSEGVNWLAVGAGAGACWVLGWFWLAPRNAATTGAMLMATGLMAWVVGLAETRQAFLPLVVVVLTVMAFVAMGGLSGGKKLGTILRESGFVLAAAIVLFAAQVMF